MLTTTSHQREEVSALDRFKAHRCPTRWVFSDTGTRDKALTTRLPWPRSLCEKEKATRGLLATDHVILNHGQVTWTTPELAPPSPNYHTTPTGGRFSSRQI
ncbi:hypothetical protein TNCV_2487691 [Trichonephila clavipes]|uniref:Uncharacterized protein n=1 Tax=Trichonephila clavipes TaxID=2585209 RepID=A0A8X6W085_TRICX|nr:hypothetical protein TNCV_2487691 [Trichonephila clavipes]